MALNLQLRLADPTETGGSQGRQDNLPGPRPQRDAVEPQNLTHPDKVQRELGFDVYALLWNVFPGLRNLISRISRAISANHICDALADR